MYTYIAWIDGLTLGGDDNSYDGQIIDVLVKNSEPVEYNQALFIIEPT